jgi:hypothetical protein
LHWVTHRKLEHFSPGSAVATAGGRTPDPTAP